MPKEKSFLGGALPWLVAGLVAGIAIGSYACFLWMSGFFCKEESSFSCEIKGRKVELFLDGRRFLDVRDFGTHEHISVFRGEQAIAAMGIDDSSPSKGVIDVVAMMDNKKEGKKWCKVINCDFADEGDSIEFSKGSCSQGGGWSSESSEGKR